MNVITHPCLTKSYSISDRNTNSPVVLCFVVVTGSILSGVGFTKQISCILLISPFFNIIKTLVTLNITHDDVIKWKHFPRYWPFVREIHRSPVNCPHKGQWRGALQFSLICVWINGWVNNREAGDLRRYRAHYDVIVMVHIWQVSPQLNCWDSWQIRTWFIRNE